MTVYRAHNADCGDWHEIVGESGEAGEGGCMMTAIKAVGWAMLAGAVIGLTILASGYAAFSWDLS